MSETTKRKVLIVDDEEEVLEFLGSVIKRAGYDVYTSARGKEAIELAQTIVPDIMLLDVVIPDMEGGEVAAVLSENPVTANIPIIFLTGILTKEEAVSRAKTGKHFMMAKPTTSEEVINKIEEILTEEI
jgi:DNA-binding response OmpR family regulator